MNSYIKQLVHDFNVISTSEIDDQKKNQGDRDYNTSINYNNCISLFDMCNIFIDGIQNSRKDYKNLESLANSGIFSVKSFESTDNKKELVLDVSELDGNKKKSDIMTVVFKEDNGEISSKYTTNYQDNNDSEFCDLKLEERIVKEYLDFMDKYDDFFDAYKKLMGNYIFNISGLVLKLEYSSMLFDAKKIIITFRYNYIKEINFFEGNIDMETGNFTIRKMIVNGEVVDDPDLFVELLKNIYINVDYLPEYFKKNANLSYDNNITKKNELRLLRKKD